MTPNAAARHYYGPTADTYDARRSVSARWRGEHAIVAGWLEAFPAGTTVIDVPVGTGRFLGLCLRRGYEVVGMDASADMLAQARGKADGGATLLQGDIRAIALADRSRDVAIAVRILNLLAPDDLRRAILELQRVADKAIMCSLRVAGRRGQMARAYRVQDIEAHLVAGWRIGDDVACVSDGYRMLRLIRS